MARTSTKKAKVDYTPLINQFIDTRRELRHYEKQYEKLRAEIISLGMRLVPGKDNSLVLVDRYRSTLDTTTLKIDMGDDWYQSYCKDTEFYEIIIISNDPGR